MAKISNTTAYPNQTPVNLTDYLIGTDAVGTSPNLQTKTFTVSALGAALGVSSPANPTAEVSGVVVNGVATTYMRSDAAPKLANTAVSAGVYTNTDLTVDAQGRITSASSGSSATNPTGVATGLDLAATQVFYGGSTAPNVGKVQIGNFITFDDSATPSPGVYNITRGRFPAEPGGVTSSYIKGYEYNATSLDSAFNTAYGAESFNNNNRSLITTASSNVAFGQSTLAAIVSGIGNTAIGTTSLASMSTGQYNTALGNRAGQNTTGNNNIFIGFESGAGAAGGVATGGDNIAIGFESMELFETATKNTIIGNNAGKAITSSGYNTILGCEAGDIIISSIGYHTLVGYNSNPKLASSTYGVAIGQSSAVGTEAVAIGTGSDADDEAVAIGGGSIAKGQCIAIGNGTQANRTPAGSVNAGTAVFSIGTTIASLLKTNLVAGSNTDARDSSKLGLSAGDLYIYKAGATAGTSLPVGESAVLAVAY